MDVLTHILNATPALQGGLTLMIAGWLGYQLRSLPSRAAELFRHCLTREIEIRDHSPLYEAWLEMVTQAALRPGGPRTLEVRSIYCDSETVQTAFKAGTDSFWARICGRWCRVRIGREPGAVTPRHDEQRRFIITIEVLRATQSHLSAMLAEAKRRTYSIHDRQIVEICDKSGSKHTLYFPKRGPETLCLPSDLFEPLEARIRDFLSSREQYERVGIPWRFGILLHGKPGTGKTSLAHVLASRLGLRLAVIPLADFRSDEDLIEAFSVIGKRTIVLLEDIDSAFRQRSAQDTTGISFSGFLNCIDGMLAPQNGRILLMSTNHINHLDPALIRPGRVDLRIEVPLLTKQAASDYVDRLFSHIPTRHNIVREVMVSTDPTPAALINRIMREPWHRSNFSTTRRPISAPTKVPVLT